MFKKISLALMVALLTAVSIVGLASAKTDTQASVLPAQHPNHRTLIGQITEIGSDQFTATGLNGETHTIIITAYTVFGSRAADPADSASFDDLEAGMWVSVVNHTDSSGQFSARLVVILPEDFDPTSIQTQRAIGEVDKINNGQNTFDIITRSGETLTFSVNDKTRFAGTISELKDLSKGMMVGVFAVEQEDGSLLAKIVVDQKLGRETLAKVGGTIDTVYEEGLTLTTRSGEVMTFNLTEKTRFASRDAAISGLEDVEPDMAVMVVFKPDSGETPDAAAVMVLDQALLNLSRARGEVQSAGGSHLTLQTASGETLNFSVDENTRLRGQGIEDLQDIKNGMKALVLYKTEADGSLLAMAILVRAVGGE
ncbi:MAG TPA: DUF5666 domain-containing protein [Anaerolineales bacterium]|nr:DUF5666 domain-containing protein [Anaerolineales bacterium]